MITVSRKGQTQIADSLHTITLPHTSLQTHTTDSIQTCTTLFPCLQKNHTSESVSELGIEHACILHHFIFTLHFHVHSFDRSTFLSFHLFTTQIKHTKLGIPKELKIMEIMTAETPFVTHILLANFKTETVVLTTPWTEQDSMK